VSPASAARPGSKLELTVDPSRFYYFDTETGANLANAQLAASAS
jgi:hypothetical protein